MTSRGFAANLIKAQCASGGKPKEQIDWWPLLNDAKVKLPEVIKQAGPDVIAEFIAISSDLGSVMGPAFTRSQKDFYGRFALAKKRGDSLARLFAALHKEVQCL